MAKRRQDPVLIEKLRKLLDKKLSESKYQRFLEENTEFVPLSFLLHHDVHLDVVFKQYPIFEDYAVDFMFLTKTSGKWRCVLIELEKPQSKFFKGNKNEPHKDFVKGLNQVKTWKAHLDVPEHLAAFKSKMRCMMRHMSDNPMEVRYALVFGRRSEYANNVIRSRKIRAEESEELQILSFDSLLELKNRPLYLASKHNEYVRLISGKERVDTILYWMEPELLRLSKSLKAALLKDIKAKRLPPFGRGIPSLYEPQRKALLALVRKIAVSGK